MPLLPLMSFQSVAEAIYKIMLPARCILSSKKMYLLTVMILALLFYVYITCHARENDPSTFETHIRRLLISTELRKSPSAPRNLP